MTIELIKYIQGCVLDDHRNAFLNLALPTVMVSEPAPANKIRIKDEMYFTDWDRWEVHGPEGYKMQDFVQYFQVRAGGQCRVGKTNFGYNYPWLRSGGGWGGGNT